MELLTNVLRMKNNRQPTVILKALPADTKDTIRSTAILSELRYRTDPTKKIILALSQKALDQFLIDVNLFFFVSKRKLSFACFRRRI